MFQMDGADVWRDGSNALKPALLFAKLNPLRAKDSNARRMCAWLG